MKVFAFVVLLPFAHSFCNSIKAKALCTDLKEPMENGCCAKGNNCPKWCQTRHEIIEPSHITGHWSNGTKWGKQCVCRFCLGSQAAIIPMPVQERMMRAHNFFRCLHAFPPLENWSFKLELNSKKEYEHCILTHAKTFENDPVSGENKAVGAAMPEFNVAMWYLEINNIDPITMRPSGSDPIGHFSSMIWKSTKDIGCGLCFPVIQNQFVKGKPDTGDFLWTCHYSNSPPNDLMGLRDNLPDLTQTKNARTMDECCEMVYPEYYDNVTKLQPQMHEAPDFMWMDYDLALPTLKRRLTETMQTEDLYQLQEKFRMNEESIPELRAL